MYRHWVTFTTVDHEIGSGLKMRVDLFCAHLNACGFHALYIEIDLALRLSGVDQVRHWPMVKSSLRTHLARLTPVPVSMVAMVVWCELTEIQANPALGTPSTVFPRGSCIIMESLGVT